MLNRRPQRKIPPEVLLAAGEKFDELAKTLNPHLSELTPPERLSLKKTGPALIEFLKLSHAFSVECPELFPMFIKTETFRDEYFATSKLWVLLNKINLLGESVSDTVMLSGSRTLEVALAFYLTVKVAARRDIPGARVIFDELKSAYPSGTKSRKKSAEDRDRQLKLFDD